MGGDGGFSVPRRRQRRRDAGRGVASCQRPARPTDRLARPAGPAGRTRGPHTAAHRTAPTKIGALRSSPPGPPARGRRSPAPSRHRTEPKHRRLAAHRRPDGGRVLIAGCGRSVPGGRRVPPAQRLRRYPRPVRTWRACSSDNTILLGDPVRFGRTGRYAAPRAVSTGANDIQSQIVSHFKIHPWMSAVGRYPTNGTAIKTPARFGNHRAGIARLTLLMPDAETTDGPASRPGRVPGIGGGLCPATYCLARAIPATRSIGPPAPPSCRPQ